MTPEENEEVFRKQIVPAFLTGPPSRERPVAVIVGGQTGAGKTEVTKLVKQQLGEPGTYTNINMDFYNAMHPDFAGWQAEDPATASARVRPDGELWWTKAQEYAIEHRHDVVLESAMRDPSEFEDIAARFHGAGYRVEAALLAVPPALSRLGVLSRYQDEVEEVGTGRYVDPAVHDECCAGVLRGAAAVDAGGLADSAVAYRRSGEVVYANHVDADGNWLEPARLAEAVEEERRRPWTEPERVAYEHDIADLRERAGQEWAAELDAIDRAAAPLLHREEPPDLDAAAARIRQAREAVAEVRQAGPEPEPGPEPGPEPEPEPPAAGPRREPEIE
jgi:hypothetical protein